MNISSDSRTKAGIVTFHNAYNMGACLQAYATLSYFNLLGCDAGLIDYLNDTEQGNKKILYSPDGSAKEAFASLIKNAVFKKRKCMQKSYDGDAKLYEVGTGEYGDLHAMSDLRFDLLVAGSDQIWNPQITGRIDEAFFLNFGTGSPRKISFASSAGSYRYSSSELELVTKLLSDFDLITVREKCLRDQIQPLLKKEVFIVPDPTIMFDGSFWRSFSTGNNIANDGNSQKENYALAYFVGGGFETYYPKIERYIKNLGIPVYNIQFNKMKRHGAQKAVIGATPREFVSLIDNASFFFTDSFHGVAFATSLGTPFVAIENKKNPLRVAEFLETCELQDRLEPEMIGGESSNYFNDAQMILGNLRIKADRLIRSHIIN